MEGKQRFIFLATVFFFSGAVVLIAAHEMRERTMREGRGDTERARELIKELRGDILARKAKDSPDVVAPDAVPTRRPGSYLPENDRKKLNDLLKNVLPSPE